jgi:hypothetical protein
LRRQEDAVTRNVIVGSVLLAGGAALVDVGFWTDHPALEQAGNLAMILAGVGLMFLPAALGTTPKLGRVLYWSGIALASLVDVPAVLDPADLRAGRVLGFPAMLLLSTGLVLLWRRTRITALLVAAVWFFIQITPNVLLFIIPNQRPSFVLQVIGVAIALSAAAVGAGTRPRKPDGATTDVPIPTAPTR